MVVRRQWGMISRSRGVVARCRGMVAGFRCMIGRSRCMVGRSRGVVLWGRGGVIVSLALVGDVGHESIVVVCSVSDVLSPPVRESHGVGPDHVPLGVLALPGLVRGTRVVIVHSVLVAVRLRLLLHRGVMWGGGVVSWGRGVVSRG